MKGKFQDEKAVKLAQAMFEHWRNSSGLEHREGSSLGVTAAVFDHYLELIRADTGVVAPVLLRTQFPLVPMTPMPERFAVKGLRVRFLIEPEAEEEPEEESA